MIKHGSPPYLECSSRGYKRFSAFYARLPQFSNKTIEELYQGSKIFEDGATGLSCKEAKGKKAINQEVLAVVYSLLWDWYIEDNPHLLKVLREASGLSDMFGQEGHVCQATELWRIRNETNSDV